MDESNPCASLDWRAKKEEEEEDDETLVKYKSADNYVGQPKK